jgi:ATP-dependent DNA ligase
MEARSVAEIPAGPQWQYEPKWDGFRCLLSRDRRTVQLVSKSGQDLTRYFPEIATAAAALPEKSFVLDGELVIPVGKHYSFDALLQRIHPAASRIKRLSEEAPALYIAFDLLRAGRSDLAAANLTIRRSKLKEFAAHCFADTLFHLSPASKRLSDAKRWLANAGEGSDGVIAKRIDLPYQAGNREGMVKIKQYRTADCVIGGFRYGERKQGGMNVVGSLLLGLYDDQGLLHHVGFTSGLKAGEKPALTKKLEAIQTAKSFTGNTPGGPSRWSTKRSSEWHAVETRLVVEVSYDHFTGGRFRHGTTIERWRPDKKARDCTLVQLKQKTPSAVKAKRKNR